MSILSNATTSELYKDFFAFKTLILKKGYVSYHAVGYEGDDLLNSPRAWVPIEEPVSAWQSHRATESPQWLRGTIVLMTLLTDHFSECMETIWQQSTGNHPGMNKGTLEMRLFS